MSAVEDIAALLSRTIGLDPSSLGEQAIAIAVRVRMAALKVASAADYLALVRRLPGEVQELIEETVVPETWFFRDEAPFVHLADVVVTEWRARHVEGTFRVLSLPCSTGEEPYSIAMALDDAGLPRSRYHVDAIDVSARALERAARAAYGPNAFRGELGRRARERHFVRDGDEHRLSPAMVAQVTFVRGNLLDVGFAPPAPTYDAIFCRNLVIYLDRSARTAAIAVVDRHLARHGILFAGHAEALDLIDPRFRLEPAAGAFAYRRHDGTRRTAPMPAVEAAVAPWPPAPRRPAAPPVERPPEVPATEPPADIARALELADAGKLDEARALCDVHLRERGPDADAYCLMGIIAQAGGEGARAEEYFRRAVYLDRSHHRALVYLALLHDQRGDAKAAAQLRRRAARSRS